MRKDRLLTGLTVLVGVTAAVAGCSATGPVAEIEPPAQSSDYGTNMVRCLSAKGWDVSPNADGGYNSRVPAEQETRFESDQQECMAEFGYDKEFSVTVQQASSFYDKLVDSARCLREQGYAISDPPSRQAFMETLVGGELPSWAPYSELLEITKGSGAMRQAEAACPQPTSW